MSKATKESPSLEVALTGGEIPTIMKALDAKMKEYEFIKDSKWKTTGKLEGFPDIKTETLVTNLIRAFSSVQARAEAYHKGAAALGLTEYPEFELSGGTEEDWKSDIQLRIKIIEQKDTMDLLEECRKEASKFVSEAEQKNMFLDKMAGIAKKLAAK